jgi:hypothetical protein
MGFTPREMQAVLRIKVELTDPKEKEDDGGWSLTATATVSDRQGLPVPNVDVQFYHIHDNVRRKVDEPVSTDGDGHTDMEFEGLKKGKHRFEAQIVGTTIRARSKVVEFKETEIKTPKNLDVHVVGRAGEYELLVSVRTEKERSVKDAKVRIVDAKVEPSVNVITTDKDGFASHRLSFRDRVRVIKIIAPGGLTKSVTLYGPMLRSKPQKGEGDVS